LQPVVAHFVVSVRPLSSSLVIWWCLS
jgi:hypothetical protein